MIIELPNGQELEFPDGTSPDIMRNAIYKNFPEYASLYKGDEKEIRKPSVSQDIANSISEIPHALLGFFTNLPGQVLESSGQIAHHPLRAAENLGAGLLEGIKGGLNIPSNIASYMQSRGIGSDSEENAKFRDLIAKLHIPDTGLEKSILGENQKGDEFLRAIGSFAPYARLGGLTGGIGGAARRAASTASYATGQEEDPLRSALMGLAGEGIVRGVQGMRTMPSSPLSAEELREALQNTKGTETSLGNVIQNPFLKRQFENILPEIPLSGANQAMQRTASDITQKGEKILDAFKGNNEVGDIGSSLHKALKESAEETRKSKNAKFNILNEAADKEGIKTDRSNLIRTAKETLDEIKNDPHLESLTDSTARSILQSIVNEKNKANYSLKNTDLLRGKIGKKIRDAYQTGNTDLRDILQPLKDAATQDINDAIDNSKKPHLKELRDEAFNYYQKEYAPFKEPEIEKFTLRGGDPDLLASAFLKKSTVSDRGKLLEKLTSKLTDDQRKLLAYSYFSKALTDGKVNPLKLRTQYNALGENQKKALLDEDELKKLRDYSALVEKNTDPLNIMFNPKTGQRGLSDTFIKSLLIGGGAGSFVGGLPAAIVGSLSPAILARPAVKTLTNPWVREKLIERMIKARNREPSPKRNISPIVQALMQVSSKGMDDTNNRGIDNGIR